MSDEWKSVALSEIAHIQQGKTLAVKAMNGGDHPVFGANGVIGYFTEGTYEHLTIALGCRGSCGTVHIAAAGSYLANNVMGIWPKDAEVVNLEWLALALEGADLVSSGVISGQVQPQITRQSLQGLRLTLPPLAVQRRIVDLLAHLDNHLANLQTERDAARVLLTSTYDSVFGKVAAFRDLSSVLTTARAGGTPSRSNPRFYDGDVPWLKSGEVANPHIVTSEESISSIALQESSAWLVPAESTVVAMYGATAGAAGYLDEPMATNQAVLALVPDHKHVVPRFLYHVLRWQSKALKEKASGAAQPNLSKQVVLRETRFPDTSLEQQALVAAVLDALEDDASLLEMEINQLTRVRGFLLRSLLSDSLSIPSAYDSFLPEVA